MIISEENDANPAALDERSFGWGSSAGTFVYITIGTGVGICQWECDRLIYVVQAHEHERTGVQHQ